LTLIFKVVSLVSSVLCIPVFIFRFVLTGYLTSLFSFLTNIFFLLSLSLFFELPFVLYTINLLFNFSWSSFDELVVNHISSAYSLFDFNKAKFHARAKLVQSQCDLSILFLVLKVVWELNFASREVVYFRL